MDLKTTQISHLDYMASKTQRDIVHPLYDRNITLTPQDIGEVGSFLVLHDVKHIEYGI